MGEAAAAVGFAAAAGRTGRGQVVALRVAGLGGFLGVWWSEWMGGEVEQFCSVWTQKLTAIGESTCVWQHFF